MCGALGLRAIWASCQAPVSLLASERGERQAGGANKAPAWARALPWAHPRRPGSHQPGPPSEGHWPGTPTLFLGKRAVHQITVEMLG